MTFVRVTSSADRAARPRYRDELAFWSTARRVAVAGAVPGVADEPPPGWTELVDGRGVFLRRTQRTAAAGTTDAWYVHGLAGSSSNWTSLAGLMSARATGHLVDMPGHGRSDPPPLG